MSIYSDFERKEHDKYYTPYEAVPPLLQFLKPRTKFVEPTAGDGRLIRHLESHGHECVYACDIKPEGPGIEQRDILFFDKALPDCDMIITNPPWDRELLHPMIDIFTAQADTWLLFDAAWPHTLQAIPFKNLCKKIVSIGRISWEGNGVSGTQDCCWYLFSKKSGPCEFTFR